MQVLNNIAKYSLQKQLEIAQQTNTSTTSTISKREIDRQKEAVSGEKKDDRMYKTQTDIIKQFLDKCNAEDIQGAYDLITDDCKQAEYPSINDFIDGYYANNFKEKQSYNYQLWSEDTYKIELRPDILTTGIYSENIYVEDYYTVDGDKLNIGGYVKRKQINRNIEKSNVRVNINYIDFYRDYAICKMEVFNKNNDEILLDTGENMKSVYFVDKNEVEYDSFIEEINEDDLRVTKGENKQLKIRFNCSYRKDLSIRKIIFNNIIMNYNNYLENQINQDEILKLEISI